MLRPFKKPHGRLPRGPSVPSPPRNQHARTFLRHFRFPPLILSRVEGLRKSFSTVCQNVTPITCSCQVHFLLLRRFGVQFYTERSYHLENGVKVGTAFA